RANRGVDARRVLPTDKKSIAALRAVLLELDRHFSDPATRDRPFEFAGPNVLAIADELGTEAAKEAMFVDASGDRDGDISTAETARLEEALETLTRDAFASPTSRDRLHQEAASDLARTRSAKANLARVLEGRPDRVRALDSGSTFDLRAKLARAEE